MAWGTFGGTREAGGLPGRVHRAPGPVFAVGHQMAIGRQHERRIFVPESLGDRHHRFTGRQQDRSEVMPEVVARRSSRQPSGCYGSTEQVVAVVPVPRGPPAVVVNKEPSSPAGYCARCPARVSSTTCGAGIDRFDLGVFGSLRVLLARW
jgi:hypothetical protein